MTAVLTEAKNLGLDSKGVMREIENEARRKSKADQKKVVTKMGCIVRYKLEQDCMQYPFITGEIMLEDMVPKHMKDPEKEAKKIALIIYDAVKYFKRKMGKNQGKLDIIM